MKKQTLKITDCNFKTQNVAFNCKTLDNRVLPGNEITMTNTDVDKLISLLIFMMHR